MNDSKPAGFPINEENVQRTAAHMATVGPFVRRRAAEFGQQWAASWAAIMKAGRDPRG